MNKGLLILYLLFTPVVFAEILSGNTPFTEWANLMGALGLILSYGVPLILIWDYRLRYNIGFLSLIILGMTYSIFNEGLMAKTIVSGHEIVGGFMRYGVIGGLNLAWSLLIIPWHAVYSIIFPILFAEILFKEKQEIIIPSKIWTVFIGICVLFLLPYIARNLRGSMDMWTYVVLYIGVFSGIIISYLTRSVQIRRNAEYAHSKRKIYIFGVMSILFILFLMISGGHIPILFYILIGITGWYSYLRYLSYLHPDNAVIFALGSISGLAIGATILTLFQGRIDVLIATCVTLPLLHRFIFSSPHHALRDLNDQ